MRLGATGIACSRAPPGRAPRLCQLPCQPFADPLLQAPAVLAQCRPSKSSAPLGPAHGAPGQQAAGCPRWGSCRAPGHGGWTHRAPEHLMAAAPTSTSTPAVSPSHLEAGAAPAEQTVTVTVTPPRGCRQRVSLPAPSRGGRRRVPGRADRGRARAPGPEPGAASRGVAEPPPPRSPGPGHGQGHPPPAPPPAPASAAPPARGKVRAAPPAPVQNKPEPPRVGAGPRGVLGAGDVRLRLCRRGAGAGGGAGEGRSRPPRSAAQPRSSAGAGGPRALPPLLPPGAPRPACARTAPPWPPLPPVCTRRPPMHPRVHAPPPPRCPRPCSLRVGAVPVHGVAVAPSPAPGQQEQEQQ